MTAPISNEPTTTRLHHYAGRYYACWFENESFRVQVYRFEAEAFKPAGQPCVVNVHSLHGEDLVVIGIPDDVELWLAPEFDV